MVDGAGTISFLVMAVLVTAIHVGVQRTNARACVTTLMPGTRTSSGPGMTKKGGR
jgi:hypothetical protein